MAEQLPSEGGPQLRERIVQGDADDGDACNAFEMTFRLQTRHQYSNFPFPFN